ncbi:MAG: hypothetical protein DRJ50_10585, partial [Actinobacteria bacterium]
MYEFCDSQATDHPARNVMGDAATVPPCCVFIAEDHVVAQAGLDFLLSRVPGVEIVGHARDGEAALEDVARLEPDILLLD